MESYILFDQKSDIDFYSRHLEPEDSPQLFQQQAQLPSFRDVSLTLCQVLIAPWPVVDTVQIILPRLQTPLDHHYQSQNFDAQTDIVTPSTQGLSATPRSIVTSPTHSQGSSMPSLTGDFDEMNVRGSEAMFSNTAHTMGTMDRSTWMPATQYQSMPTAYAQPTQRVSQMNPQTVSSRTSPSLPPIRDINQQRTNSYDPTYGTSSSQMGHVTLGSYPQMYATSQAPTTDMDTTGFSRSMSYNDGTYRYPTSYPQATRPYQTTDYSRYAGTPYDPYRYSQAAYSRTSYGDMNYPPHAMVGSQSMTLGVQGELSGSHNRRRRGNLPKHVTDILRSWFHDHLDHPYPSEEDKQIFMQKTNLTISQVSRLDPEEMDSINMLQISNWFINARRRHWPALKQSREQARNPAFRRSNSAGGSA